MPGTERALTPHTAHRTPHSHASFKLLDVPEDRGGGCGHDAATATVIKAHQKEKYAESFAFVMEIQMNYLKVKPSTFHGSFVFFSKK